MSPHRDRRRFTAAYKLKILEEAARCVESGSLGALLRREGLYSSHLAAWRAAAKAGTLTGAPRRRGPKPTPPDPKAQRILVFCPPPTPTGGAADGGRDQSTQAPQHLRGR